MALEFANTAASPNIDYITYSGVPPVAGLGTCSVVMRIAGDSDSQNESGFLQVTDAGTLNSVAIARFSGNSIYLIFRNAGNGIYTMPFTFDGVMRSLVATFNGTASPKVVAYVDGVSQTISTAIGASATIGTGMNSCAIPASSIKGNGRVADVGIYNRVITPAEALVHAAGYSCRNFPRGLIFYAPLIREVHDIAGGLTGTITGTTVSDHPRIYA